MAKEGKNGRKVLFLKKERKNITEKVYNMVIKC